MDNRLIWNPLDYDNITEITLPVSKLWVPDIVLQVRGLYKFKNLNYFFNFKFLRFTFTSIKRMGNLIFFV